MENYQNGIKNFKKKKSQRNSHTHCQSRTCQRFNQSFVKECVCSAHERPSPDFDTTLTRIL
jgi:hypothetical protein